MQLHRIKPRCDCCQVIFNVAEADNGLLNIYCRTAGQLVRI